MNSPLALLAKTCSSIGKESTGMPQTAPKSTSCTVQNDSSTHSPSQQSVRDTNTVQTDAIYRNKNESTAIVRRKSNSSPNHRNKKDVSMERNGSRTSNDIERAGSQNEFSSVKISATDTIRRRHQSRAINQVSIAQVLNETSAKKITRSEVGKDEGISSPTHTRISVSRDGSCSDCDSCTGRNSSDSSTPRDSSSVSRNKTPKATSTVAMTTNDAESHYVSNLTDSGLLQTTIHPSYSSVLSSAALDVQRRLHRLQQESLAIAAFRSATASGILSSGPTGTCTSYSGLFYNHPVLQASRINPALMYAANMRATAASGLRPSAQSLLIESDGGTSPYASRVRMETPSGGSTVASVCRDPMCSAASALHASHHVSSSLKFTPFTLNDFSQRLSYERAAVISNSVNKCITTEQFASIYPLFSSSFATGRPSRTSVHKNPHLELGNEGAYICNWVFEGTFCGKRFQTSEDLVQHLSKMHMLSVENGNASSVLSAFPTSNTLPFSHGFLPPQLYNALAMDLSSRSNMDINSPFVQPSSISPTSLFSEVSRYHPYKLPFVSPVAKTPSNSRLRAYYTSPYELLNHQTAVGRLL